MKITNWIVTVFVFLSLTEERKWAGHECNGCLGAGGDREEGGGHYTGRWHREGPPRSHGQLCTYWERERCPWQLCAERERERKMYTGLLISQIIMFPSIHWIKKHFYQFCIFKKKLYSTLFSLKMSPL